MRSKTIIKQIILRNFYDLLKNHQHNSRHSKKFWVLKIIDLQQGKHSFNHHIGVESREQIVGIWFLLSHHLLYFFNHIVEENVMNPILKKDQQDSLYYPVLWSITQLQSYLRWWWLKLLVKQTDSFQMETRKGRHSVKWLFCVIKKKSVLPRDEVKIPLVHKSKCVVHFIIIG